MSHCSTAAVDSHDRDQRQLRWCVGHIRSVRDDEVCIKEQQ
jgi:hypothetical protein